MIHDCKIHCRTLSADQEDLLGVDDDGKWLPFMFDLDMIDAIKLASDDDDSFVFACTTIYCKSGDVYNIDTKYDTFAKKFTKYVTSKNK